VFVHDVIETICFEQGALSGESLVGHSDQMDLDLHEFFTEIVVKPVGIVGVAGFEHMGSELFKRPVSVVLNLLVGPVAEFSVLKVNTDVGNESTGIVGLGVVGVQRQSCITIMVISNERVGGGNKQERSETELSVLDQKEVVDVVLDQVIVLNNTASRTVLIELLDLGLFSISNREDTLSFMDISTDLTEINDVSFLFKLLILGTKEFLKEFFTLFLISQHPGLGEILVETEALLSGFISLSISDQSVTGLIFSVKIFVASNMVGVLGQAGILLADLSVEEEKVENEVNVSIQRCVIELVLLLSESWGDILTDLGDDLPHELVATSKVSDEICLFGKDKLGVLNKVSSMLIAVVEIWLQAHHLGVVVGSLDDTVFDDFENVKLGKEIVSGSRIVEVVRTVDWLEVANEDSVGRVSSILVECEESDSQKVEGKDAQGYTSD
jgi:hypothetical protein